MTDDRTIEEEPVRPGEEGREFLEEADTLWVITLGPAVWAVHFLVAYTSAAVYCAKSNGAAHSLFLWRIGLGAGTVLTLALLAWLAWRAFRSWDVLADRELVQRHDTNEDRHRFLGHAGFLLCGVSIIGVVYTALPGFFLMTCR